ncbi:MAG: hypothetical protein JWL90_2143 [Chthoniobacteraceae bacterium]|nr:hypothetical protein [Chthoniobacteraceae bacterium]
MVNKSKLELSSLSDPEVIALSGLIVTSMTGNDRYKTPNPPLKTLTTQSTAIDAMLAERDALLQQAQTLTLKIRATRTALEQSLNAQSLYVDAVVATLPTTEQPGAITSAGMSVAGTTTAPVGSMPKVEGLTATTGDSEGMVDLSWNAVRRGLQNFLIELTDDPAGQGGWRFGLNSRKSSATVTGLKSGQRYWFRVTAEGAAGPGPTSSPATKVAP